LPVLFAEPLWINCVSAVQPKIKSNSRGEGGGRGGGPARQDCAPRLSLLKLVDLRGSDLTRFFEVQPKFMSKKQREEQALLRLKEQADAKKKQ